MMTDGGTDRYDLLRVACSMLAHPVNDPDPAPADAKARREHYQAELARLRFEKESGELISRQLYEEGLAERSAWFVAVLKAMPAKLATKLAGKSAAEVMRLRAATCREIQMLAFGEAGKPTE